MVVANLNEMLENKIGDEYEYKGHRWINVQQSCGCIIAICTSTEPTKEDGDFATKNMTKFNTLQALIKEAARSTDVEIKNKFSDFQKELEETRIVLKDFVVQKRKQYNFPDNADFNSEHYFIKLKQDSGCKGNNY